MSSLREFNLLNSWQSKILESFVGSAESLDTFKDSAYSKRFTVKWIASLASLPRNDGGGWIYSVNELLLQRTLRLFTKPRNDGKGRITKAKENTSQRR